MAEDPNSTVLYRAARAFETHPGRMLLAAFVGAVTFFFFGFAFVKGLEDARGLELVPRGTYIPRPDATGYLKRDDVDANYINKAIVARDYTANVDVQRNYIPRERCQSGAALPGTTSTQSSTLPAEPNQHSLPNSPPGSPPSPSATTTPPSQPSAQYIQGFEIERPACTWSAGRVNCSFRVTNTEPGRRYLQLIMDAGSSARSYLVDNSGRRYYASAMMFGGDGPGFERFIGEQIESGVPTAAAMGFEASEKPTSTVVLVLIVGTVNKYPVVFRDLRVGP